MNKKFMVIILLVLILLVGCKTSNNQPDIRIINDISYGNHVLMKYDVYAPRKAENAPIVFVVHGGEKENVDSGEVDKRGMKGDSLFYANNGFITVAINYRWSDAPYGSKTHDVACAIASFRQEAEKYGGDPDNIMIQGYSGGGFPSAFLYFYPENDWLSDCEAKEKFNLKGFIMKASYFYGREIAEGIDFESVEGGTKIVVTQEIIDSFSEETLSKAEEKTLELGMTLKDGAINHIDATDKPMLFIYGDSDDVLKERGQEEMISFQNKLENNKIDYQEIILPGVGHVFKVKDYPESKRKSIKYFKAVANGEPFPF